MGRMALATSNFLLWTITLTNIHLGTYGASKNENRAAARSRCHSSSPTSTTSKSINPLTGIMWPRGSRLAAGETALAVPWGKPRGPNKTDTAYTMVVGTVYFLSRQGRYCPYFLPRPSGHPGSASGKRQIPWGIAIGPIRVPAKPVKIE